MLKRYMALVVGFIALSGCGKLRESTTDPGNGNPPDPTATFSRVQTEIFDRSCALGGCHDTNGRQGDMILARGSSYAQIVNRPSSEISSFARVEPQQPDRSYLYLKVTGAPGIVGEKMPFGGPYLSDSQLQLIRDWIRRGAPND
jgi:hypothetical protein